MKKTLSSLFMLCIMSIVLLAPNKVYAATVGATLTNPESGWQRIDEKNNTNLVYTGSWVYNISDLPGRWGGTIAGSATGTSVKFKFYGTKLRIISENVVGHSTNVGISIDSGSEDKTSVGFSSPRVLQSLCYERLNLPLGFHTVIITNYDTKYGMPLDAIDIDADGYMVDFNQPQNLKITSTTDKQVSLDWNPIDGAASYNVKYGTAPGVYTNTKSVTGTSVTVEALTSGTKYYFVVSSIVSGKESKYSNEVSTSLQAFTNAILEVTMSNGTIKEYDMTFAEINDFLTWYDGRSQGAGLSYYVILKKNNISPFVNRKEYLSYNMISSFEVKEYIK